jgi:hypothetical protein
MTEGAKVVKVRNFFGWRSGLKRRRIYTINFTEERRVWKDRRIGPSDRRRNGDRGTARTDELDLIPLQYLL